MSVGFLWPRSRETLAAGLVSEAPDVAAEDLVVELSHCRHVDRDEHDPAVSGVTPMPTTLEVLAPGTVLEGRVLFTGASDIERACIAYGLDRLSAIGGKAAAGLGAVTVTHDGDAAAYAEWIASVTVPRDLAVTTDLRERLEALAATLLPKPGKAKPEKSAKAPA